MDQAVASFVRRNLLISLVSLPIVLLAGVFARELTRFTAPNLPPDALQEATLIVLLGHGHAFVLLCLVPALFAGAAAFSASVLSGGPLRWLSLSTTLYLAGALATVALILYKGYFHMVLPGEHGSINPGDQALFGGPGVLRAFVYGASHLMMGVGLIWTGFVLALAVFRTQGFNSGPR